MVKSRVGSVKSLVPLSAIIVVLFYLSGVVHGEEGSSSGGGGIDLNRGLVAYWSFDDCTARDKSGNGHDGVIHGNPRCVKGVKGKALYFDGDESDWLEFPSEVISYNKGFSLTFYLKPDSKRKNMVLFNRHYQTPLFDDRWEVYLQNNQLKFRLGEFPFGHPVNREILQSDVTTAGSYLFVAITYDSKTKSISLFIDGNPMDVHRFSNEEDEKFKSALYKFKFSRYDEGEYPYIGIIDEVRVYDRALTEKEVKALHRYGLSGGEVVTKPPYLEVTSFGVSDVNGNKIFEAGEAASVRFTLKNSGKGDAYDVRFRIAGMIERSGEIGQIKAGESVEKVVDFTVPIWVSTGQETIKLYIDAGDFSPEPISVNLYTQAPIPPRFSVSVEPDDDRVGLSLGDGDGKIEPRETIELHVKIRNTGEGEARHVKIKAESQDRRVKMVKDRDDLGNLPRGGEVNGTIAFFVPAGYDSKTVALKLSVQEETGLWTVSKVMEFEIGQESGREYVIKPSAEVRVPGKFEAEFQSATSSPEISGLPEYPLFKSPGRIALIVGVGNYENLPKLPYSVNDARLMREIALKVMGVKEENLKYLEDPTLAELRKAIRWLISKAKAKKHPTVVIYYSGHGAADDHGQLYWLPVDADNNAKFLAETALKVKDVYDVLDELENAEVILIADACYSGKGKSVAIAGAKPLSVVKIERPVEKYSILMSSREDQISTYLEDKGFSVFTYAFYKALTIGDAMDDDGDGWIEVSEIKDYLTRKTRELSSGKGIVQTPIIEGIDAKLGQPLE